jgi:hypothetical protein
MKEWYERDEKPFRPAPVRRNAPELADLAENAEKSA